ncbi:MAG: alpha/beta hydrolase [Chloroflexi bacterium]|nr:MAG: alpha/beta hydrolase [Chloroflexota bacterium]
MTTFVLLHSPLVGPVTWSALLPELESRGIRTLAPDLGYPTRPPFWSAHANAAGAALASTSPDEPVFLVGHSGAGALLPAVRERSARGVAGYVFVDAGLPDGTQPRKGRGEFAAHLADLHSRGRRLPSWTDEDFREVIPNPGLRRRLLADLRPQPAEFWDETIPVAPAWPDAPCGYIRFSPNPSYDDAAAAAQARGWPYRDISAGHFHMLVEPAAVADALLVVTGAMRHAGTPR